MKFRPPVKHAPPPTSKRGEPLRNSVEFLAQKQLTWRLRSNDDLVHFIGGWVADGTVHESKRVNHPYTQCNADPPFEDTLADVSCLWCMAERER